MISSSSSLKKTSLAKAVMTVGGLTMLSRIFGFVRDILIAALLGGGLLMDAFVIALKIPNLFRRLFGEGAFSIAFVPLYSKLLHNESQTRSHQALEAAQAFAQNAFSVLLFGLCGLLILFEVAMPLVMMVLAPGFMDDPEAFEHVIMLSRLTMPYLPFICLVAMIGGILNSWDRFGAMAATPLLFNICLILAVLMIAPWAGNLIAAGESGIYYGYALAGTVSLSGVIQLIWMFWHLRRNKLMLTVTKPRITPQIKKLGSIMAPALLSHGVMQLNLLIDTVLASFLIQGSISYLFWADRLNQLPLGVIGIALSTALLPKLSRSLGAGEYASAHTIQQQAFIIAGALTLPAATGLFVLHHAIIKILFLRGAFDAEDAIATAQALQIFALGLPAFVLTKILTTSYYARQDTRRPLIFGVIAMGLNLICALGFIQAYGHLGLALATVIAGWANMLMLAVGLQKNRGKEGRKLLFDRVMGRRLGGQLLACAVMGGGLWYAMTYLTLSKIMQIFSIAPLDFSDQSVTGQVLQAGWLAVVVLLGGGSYLVSAFLTGGLKKTDFQHLRRRRGVKDNTDT